MDITNWTVETRHWSEAAPDGSGVTRVETTLLFEDTPVMVKKDKQGERTLRAQAEVWNEQGYRPIGLSIPKCRAEVSATISRKWGGK